MVIPLLLIAVGNSLILPDNDSPATSSLTETFEIGLVTETIHPEYMTDDVISPNLIEFRDSCESADDESVQWPQCPSPWSRQTLTHDKFFFGKSGYLDTSRACADYRKQLNRDFNLMFEAEGKTPLFPPHELWVAANPSKRPTTGAPERTRKDAIKKVDAHVAKHFAEKKAFHAEMEASGQVKKRLHFCIVISGTRPIGPSTEIWNKNRIGISSTLGGESRYLTLESVRDSFSLQPPEMALDSGKALKDRMSEDAKKILQEKMDQQKDIDGLPLEGIICSCPEKET